MGRLTTHVLDTASGKPAENLLVRLVRVNEGNARVIVCEMQTNQDGRTDKPLLENSLFRSGTYELSFQVDEYFTRTAHSLSEPTFYDVITLRFTIVHEDENYHVPLLVSQWSYSTYRGS